jgi:N-acetyl-anhydromuramyl-L-alanine amidase AmpD
MSYISWLEVRFMARTGRVGWLSLVLVILIAGCRVPTPATTAVSSVPPPASATTVATARPTPELTSPSTSTVLATPSGSSKTTDLQDAFAAASREFGVPESVLLAVAYNETRWEQHAGQPSTDGGYGVMHLTDVPVAPGAGNATGEPDPSVQINGHVSSLHTLEAAAGLLDASADDLKNVPAENIRGGAALLARYARDTVGSVPTSVADWYGAVAMYRGASDSATAIGFADTVYDTIDQGVTRVTSDGETVTLDPQTITPNRATADSLKLNVVTTFSAECPSGVTCEVTPAGSGHTNLATRPTDGNAIRYIVIHDTEAKFDGVVRTFQAPGGITSSHYLVRSSDGLIAQFVPTKDIARHAGNWYINTHSIGIEHEGFAIQGASWYSEPLYQASAKLVRYLADKYNVPLDRAHIIGHDNVPGQTPTGQAQEHWDPGPFWDWGHYMDLLGAPLKASGNPDTATVVTIDPGFASNRPVTSTCDGRGACTDLPAQSANFVYLRTEPRADAPLIADAAIQKPGAAIPGSTAASDWGDKAVIGQQFYRADRQGDWTAIYYGGQKAWFFDPANARTSIPGSGMLIQPKAGVSTVAVYGQAYPEPAAYPSGAKAPTIVPLPYTIPAGQIYVATDKITSDYARPLGGLAGPATGAIVRGQDTYYQIFFNHRIAFVRADQVDVLPLSG